ncbi:phenylalanine--tRNA ligase subunit beta [Lacisediminihabitans changchengi]|uniref:Phenylalanine--tRNA ligase beta subunit n=1 Tax=Lacisediminihabitans changchengi TaxID=2787634 RepID=A0A934SJ74_9MICO|nr:phenylalanine--tRNA ligase subunit beta [Lacisediminihabitans changchengi]MBK4347631.1 phenylalanine--tRNA ligase subunit beta [Lacisediminihabitans changchengi]
MRAPVSWLREFVDIPLDATPEDVHAALVRVGLEEEDVHSFEVTGPVVVGQVLSFEPEPQSNGKTINWCQVDVGPLRQAQDDASTGSETGRDIRGIVCGAHNFVAGDKVVVSLPGAILPGPFPIAARKTYGHVSDGMIASARELGMGEEHDGILRLASLGLDPEVGTDAIALLGLDDWAVEVNVTPDRGYAFSIRGIAREYANSTGADYRDPALAPTTVEASGVEVSVNDEAPIRGRQGCSVFVTRLVRGVDPSLPTPSWMVGRLTLAGIRSISLVVDITNYVMLELGQPLHGYDYDTLQGPIVVRRATPGETITTLDGQVRTLHAEDLLITDDSGAIGLAGVMGGLATEITSATTTVLVEAANFDPVSIARSARRHKLPSEASRRFERGVDPLVADAAAARVVELLESLAGGHADPLGSRLYTAELPAAIELPDGYVNGLTGADYTDDEARSALTAIGATIAPVLDATERALVVTPPSWRPDLTDKATLVEEVARVIGYERIPAVLPVAPPGRGLTRSQRLRRNAAQVLAANGLVEVLSYPFLSATAKDAFGASADGAVSAIKLVNPLDSEAPFLRTSLIPGLIEIARRNLSRGLTDLALFEVGAVVLPEIGKSYGSGPLPSGVVRPSDGELVDLLTSVPPQPLHVSALLLGHAVEKQPGADAVAFGVADALDVARQIASAVDASLDIRQGSHHSLHPGRTAELFVNGHSVGFAGELLPALAEELDLPRVVAVVELDLDRLIELARPEVTPHEIAGFPAATQDLSLVVPADVPAGEVLSAVVEGAGALLERAHLVADYRGTGIPEGSKSITLALRFRADDRTLKAEEASAAKLAGAAIAAERFGATIRE